MISKVTPNIQVFVLAHNRPQLLRETLKSILCQNSQNFELIVSDNSTNDLVKNLIVGEFDDQVIYRRRDPPLTSIEHLQKILDEADKSYVVLFHDDDLMLPSFVSEMSEFLEQNRKYSAAATNAYLHIKERATKKKFYPGAFSVIDVINGSEMARRYLDMGRFRMPFPGYMYRTASIRGVSIDSKEGGKHADVSFLIKLAEVAPVAWLGQPKFEYRIHSANDSWSENVYARLRLLRFIYSKTDISKNCKVVDTYRLAYWFLWWRDGSSQNVTWRRRIVRRFLFVRGLNLLLRQPALVLRLLKHRLYYIL